MSGSFYLNVMKYVQSILIAYVALLLLRVILRSFKVNPNLEPKEDDSIVKKAIVFVFRKIEYTFIITTH